jgi:hypothetical protein
LTHTFLPGNKQAAVSFSGARVIPLGAGGKQNTAKQKATNQIE